MCKKDVEFVDEFLKTIKISAINTKIIKLEENNFKVLIPAT